MSTQRWHLLVSGKVQGVSYRAATEQKALELGLTGLVRNLPDGQVEIVAEGSQSKLELLESWCFKGPDLAVVDNVITEAETPTGEFTQFKVVH